ncbi:hypothetical protein tinsulaeT_36790 [Thalassotalea insulae]|uniref:Uncharacterized protein n=1 Tax=Thalassotalea insulae TaxID=2056778 RepID=A0ABQ6GXD9_9GAMM|nr:hypothetical protein [Thalassotalea insulae]GLX80339.1 hypothetical protein tinsulaeT_36790 [Thalassotalea insulae]
MHIPQHERRKSEDFWHKALKVLALVAWGIFIVALILSYYAAPDSDFGVLRYHQMTIRKFWLTPMTGYLYILLWCSAFISYLSLIINKYRSRRKSDNKYFNFWLLFLISTAWVVYLAIQLMSAS